MLETVKKTDIAFIVARRKTTAAIKSLSSENKGRNRMLITWMISLLFFAVSTIVLVSGIFTLQSNHKAPTNRVFFALTAAITIWSSGMSLSTIASDAATSEIWRRFSAIGWGTVYAILLHFILTITGKAISIKKWWYYLYLYLPAFFSLFAFAVPNGLNPYPYNLYQTNYGWINIAQNNIWDWIFYAYYIGFTLTGLLILYRWSKKSTDNIIKRKSRIILLSIITALILGTITDVILSSLYSDLPQLAPVIMLIPVLSIYNVLQKDSFGITESIDKKTSYIILFASVLVYLVLSFLQVFLSDKSLAVGSIVLDESVIRGIIVQIQMFISIYLVLKENRPGYISSVIINTISLLSSVLFLIRSDSTASLPGIISYSGVLVIITLIKAYKEKNAAYIKRIKTQVIREEFYSKIFKQAPVGIAIMNDKSHTRNEEFEDININPAYEQILGRTKEKLQKMTWAELTDPEDLAADLAYYEQFKNGKIDQYSLEKRYIKPDGSVVWVNMLVAPFSTSGGKSDDHLCIITDITERKKMEATLKYNNEHVLLTGLYNRYVLEKILERDALMHPEGKRALIIINLSAMHILSLRYGFRYNQDMLKRIADSLRTFCNENYSLFNTHESRFVFYVKDYQDKKDLTAFCEAISHTLYSHLHTHGINGGIGVIEIDESRISNTDELLKLLLITSEMAANNNSKDNIISFYGPEIEALATREIEINQELTEIAEGINTDRLYLLFQPIFDLASNQVCGFEALARLHNEKYGLVYPLEFIPIAEKSNMIVSLGERIILQAFHFLNKLKANGHDTIAVSINISTMQLLEPGFADRMLHLINEMHLNPENVGVEITESVFATERAEINTVISALKAAEIEVLIDDFGTGYSFFSRVSELNIDCVKIDKSFIDNLLVLEPEEALAGDIISMAHKLGHCVVAEGVEHEKQLSCLRTLGCDRIQGFLISKTLDEDSALQFLENNNQ